MKAEDISIKLNEKGLKVTPQRMAIYEAILRLKNHPTAENILEYIRNNQPNISVGTIYKVLDVLTQKGLIKKVITEMDAMRYDAVLENHHHIFCSDSGRIEDYFDNELNELLERYFQQKKLPGFKVEDIRMQIIGRYKEEVKH